MKRSLPGQETERIGGQIDQHWDNEGYYRHILQSVNKEADVLAKSLWLSFVLLLIQLLLTFYIFPLANPSHDPVDPVMNHDSPCLNINPFRWS